MTTVRDIFETMEYGPAPESDAEARKWLSSHEGVFGHFIDGTWSKAGKTFEVIDPSTAAVLARVSQGTKADVDAAVAAARRAFPRLVSHAQHRSREILAHESHARLA